jgi:hypothetical protein
LFSKPFAKKSHGFFPQAPPGGRGAYFQGKLTSEKLKNNVLITKETKCAFSWLPDNKTRHLLITRKEKEITNLQVISKEIQKTQTNTPISRNHFQTNPIQKTHQPLHQ